MISKALDALDHSEFATHGSCAHPVHSATKVQTSCWKATAGSTSSNGMRTQRPISSTDILGGQGAVCAQADAFSEQTGLTENESLKQLLLHRAQLVMDVLQNLNLLFESPEALAYLFQSPRITFVLRVLRFTEELMAMFDVGRNQAYAVGRKARGQLGLDEDRYIRHPSYGGSQLFAEHFATKIAANVT